jgi:DNA replication and repair protein RecF
MLRLECIKLTQYRNYNQRTFTFTQPITGICGPNGTGKTNLLDAAYYGCFTKSYFSNLDQHVTQIGADGFRIDLDFELHNEPKKVGCVYRGSNRKEIYLNGVQYEKRADHIGLLSAVMVAPDDIELINGTSEVRRKWLDTLLCQLDRTYMMKLMEYNRILQQRNSLLKQMASDNSATDDLLAVYDAQLIPCGTLIYEKRKSICAELLHQIQQEYNTISGCSETIDLNYESALHEQSFTELLAERRYKDRMLQRTSSGTHRDELGINLDGRPLRQVGSQGQKKSLLFAMKLAELELIKKHKSYYPILLLDDVFEKLDANRMDHLLTLVCEKPGLQIIISDTHPERLKTIFEKLPIRGEIVEV